MSRPRHSKKAIEAAIQYAESQGWIVELSNGHAWGHLYCPFRSRSGCRISVWSTPRSPENHARQIVRGIDNCSHSEDDEDANDSDVKGPPTK